MRLVPDQTVWRAVLFHAARLLLACAAWGLFRYILFGTSFASAVLAMALLFGSLEIALGTLLVSTCFVVASETAFSMFKEPGFTPTDAVFVCITVLSAVLALFGRLGIPGLRRLPVEQSGLPVRLVRRALLTAAVLCACSLLFRDARPVVSIAAAFLMGLLCVQNGGTLAPSWPAARRFAGFALYLLAAAVFVAAVLEAGLRLAVQQPIPVMEFHDWNARHFFLPRPHAAGWGFYASGPDKVDRVPVRLSSLGFRDREFGPKEDDEFRILMLGDSYTFGNGVVAADSVPRQLARLLGEIPLAKRVTVINGGCAGSGPVQQLGILAERGLPLHPDLVLHQVCPSNDIEDSLILLDKRQRAFSQEVHEFYRVFRYQYLAAYRIERWLTHRSWVYQVIKKKYGMRPFAAEFLHGFALYPAFEDPPHLPPSEGRPHYLEPSLREWYPELEEGLAIFSESLLKMRDDCRKGGADFLVYCTPQMPDVDAAQWEKCMEAVKGREDEYQRRASILRIEEFLRREGFDWFSFVDAMAARPDVADFYLRHDGHCSPLGNRFVAEQIRDALVRDYFPAKGLLRQP
jgi:hypothetical protein